MLNKFLSVATLSKVSFPYPIIKPYSNAPDSDLTLPDTNLPEPLFVNIYRTDSTAIAKHVHRLKVHTVQQGGTEYIYSDKKIGLAVGVKGSKYNSGAQITRVAKRNGFTNLIFVKSELQQEETA